MGGHDPELDRLARLLAHGAGVEWDRLADYPGYSRYYWREQAEAMRDALRGACEPLAPAAPVP